jgi:hypothetical protein
MTHKKHEIAVFIENEEMLKEARELLEKYGEQTSEDCLSFEKHFQYLKLFPLEPLWFTQDEETIKQWGLTLVTLPQLEEILKNQ